MHVNIHGRTRFPQRRKGAKKSARKGTAQLLCVFAPLREPFFLPAPFEIDAPPIKNLS